MQTRSSVTDRPSKFTSSALQETLPEPPPRFSPKVPLIPRVAVVRPHSAPLQRRPSEVHRDQLTKKLNTKSAPLIPRVAIVAAQKQKEKQEKEALKLLQKAKEGVKDYSSVYSADEGVHHEYEDEFPGDEELFLQAEGNGLTPLGHVMAGVSDQRPISTKERPYRLGMDEEQFTKALVTGIAFGSSFVLKETKSYLCKIYVSAVRGEFEMERAKFIQESVIELRNYCMTMGIEFQWNDLSLGLPREIEDGGNLKKVERWCLESTLNVS
ncbi:UNVERIFIED_CONTAM: hypothetical protein HDU68_011090 [Siphonaria sp. JEL0065]|nr:hypothetical protein HDU68_011090 [Siphonaria sp. JEL0065]